MLCHLTDPDESVQDLLRVWVKRLKDFDPAKYLEVQMVALKIMFNENIVSAQASAEEDDSLDAQKVAAEGYKKVESFALRLAGTLGVAKVKGDLLQALSTFLKVGIDFAFSDGLTTLGFVRILTYYLRLLPTAELRQLAEHIDTHLVENAGIASELSDIRNAPREVKALADLASVLGGFGKNAVRKRKGSSPDESATSESEGTPDVVPKAISKPTKRSNVKLPAVEESPEVPDAAWEDKEEENRSPDVKAKPTRGTRATRAAAQPSPPRTKMTTPVKTAISAAGQRPTAISSTDPFWNRDASSSVQKKYTTRQYSASKTGSEASESSGKPIRSPRRQGAPPPAVLPVPLFVTGLHLESISPIASSDSSSRVSRRSSQGVSQEDPHHSTPVTFAEQDVSKIFAEIKQIPSRRRNR